MTNHPNLGNLMMLEERKRESDIPLNVLQLNKSTCIVPILNRMNIARRINSVKLNQL